MRSLLKIRGIMFLLFSLVISLKCNECNSAESWDKCTNKEVTCPSGLDQCLKGHAKYGKTKVYARSCSTKDLCDKEKNPSCKAAKGISGAECKITCCDKDLCNSLYCVVDMRTGIPGIPRSMRQGRHFRFHKLLFLYEVVMGKLEAQKISTLLIHS